LEAEDLLSKRFAPSKSLVSRKIGEDFLLVPIGGKTSEVDNLYTLNDVGERIWGLMDGKKSLREIVDLIADEYDVGPAEAQADLIQFVLKLESLGAVEGA
jgi:hypothetical protein